MYAATFHFIPVRNMFFFLVLFLFTAISFEMTANSFGLLNTKVPFIGIRLCGQFPLLNEGASQLIVGEVSS